jgi:hypothetical protein
MPHAFGFLIATGWLPISARMLKAPAPRRLRGAALMASFDHRL